MRLIIGIITALFFLVMGYFLFKYGLKGYMLGAFGILLGSFIYYSEAATTASEAIEYTSPQEGAVDIVFDTIRTLLLVFIVGFITSKVFDIIIAGVFNVYMIELLILFLVFSYISFWELKYTVKYMLKAMFMLDAPKKVI